MLEVSRYNYLPIAQYRSPKDWLQSKREMKRQKNLVYFYKIVYVRLYLFLRFPCNNSTWQLLLFFSSFRRNYEIVLILMWVFVEVMKKWILLVNVVFYFMNFANAYLPYQIDQRTPIKICKFSVMWEWFNLIGLLNTTYSENNIITHTHTKWFYSKHTKPLKVKYIIL